MIDLVTIPNITGVFPDVFSTNVSVPGAADGTPAIKLWVDQFWGAFQALLDHAGLTPDTVTEAAGTSQIVDAIQLASGPPGSLITWCGQESDPAVVGVRALALNGQGIVRANYAELDTAIYCGNANNATADSCFRADNADGSSRNTSGVYLILPDMRGRFVRGLDLAGTRDYQGAARIVGSYQDAKASKHRHERASTGLSQPYYNSTQIEVVARVSESDYYRIYGLTYYAWINYGSALTHTVLNFGDWTEFNDGYSDGHPYNMAVHFWIRY